MSIDPLVQSRQTLVSLTAQYLFNNIQINFSLHLRLIFGFYIYLAFTFIHFLFTRFKISLSLHLYINSTVLSHGPAASLEASRWDASLIIFLYFIHQLRSLSHRATNWQKGSNMHQKSSCGFSLCKDSLVSPTWKRSFALQHHNRLYKHNHWMGTLLRTCTFKKKKSA